MSQGISIIVPLYNKAHTLTRSLDSVFAQIDDRFEVIVVDDGSTDNSPQVVRERYGSRVILIEQKNAGPSAARNTGARHANKSHLLFLDADDELFPDALRTHLLAYERYPKASMCVTSYRTMEDGKTIDERLVGVDELRFDGEFGCFGGFHPMFIFGAHLPSISFAREMYEVTKGFDERLRCWEVTDFLLRANLLNKSIAYTNLITVLKVEDPVNSQFKKERRNTVYLDAVATRILDVIESVPNQYRRRTLRPIKSMLEDLFYAGEFDRFRRIGTLACPQFSQYGIKTRLCFLVRLPNLLLRFLSWRRTVTIARGNSTAIQN